MVNVLDQVPKRPQQEAQGKLRVPELGAQGGVWNAAEMIEEDWERMMSFSGYPRLTGGTCGRPSVIESPFAALKLRTDAAKRFKEAANATAVIGKLLLVAETTRRRASGAGRCLARLHTY